MFSDGGIMKVIEENALMQAMGLRVVVAVDGPKGIERRGKKTTARLAKKRLRKVLEEKEKGRPPRIVMTGNHVYVSGKDERDFAAARAMIRRVNQKARRRWAGFSDEERNERRGRAMIAGIGLGIAPIASLMFASLPRTMAKLAAAAATEPLVAPTGP